MDLFDELAALKSKAEEQLPLLGTKRKQENALLLPFLAALGYDPFDVRDVEPEFPIPLEEGGEGCADYAAKKGGAPAILFHLEKTGTNLDARGPAQLLRDLKQSEARVGALTDGIRYRFYADLEPFYAVLKGEATAEEEPFLTFNLFDYLKVEVEELRRLTKPEFRADEILSLAHHLKYTRLFRKYLQRQRENPDQAFVRFMMEQVHGGKPPKGDAGMYSSPVQNALRQLMGGRAKAQGHGPQGPVREEPKEEKTEGGPRQSEKALDEEDRDTTSNGEASIDQSFQEYFRERLGR